MRNLSSFTLNLLSQKTAKQIKKQPSTPVLSSTPQLLEASTNILFVIHHVQPMNVQAHFFVAHRKEASRHLVATEPRPRLSTQMATLAIC